MIICVGGIKGGCGKSLTAVNLTVLRSITKGKNVLLVDADDQGTASDWVDQRISLGINTPWTTIKLYENAVRTEVMKLKKNYDDIIIDSGGRDSISFRAALSVADIFLIPFQPKIFDIWTMSKVCKLVTEAKVVNENLKALTFINGADSRGSDTEEAESILSSFEMLTFIPATIGRRKAFSNATAHGLGVVELKNPDKKASDEIEELHDAIFK
jgi:chromosome partitioning protein